MDDSLRFWVGMYERPESTANHGSMRSVCGLRIRFAARRWRGAPVRMTATCQRRRSCSRHP